MRAPKRLPKQVVQKAKALAAAPAPERAKRPAGAPAAKDAGAKVREKLVAHLKRLHPMD